MDAASWGPGLRRCRTLVPKADCVLPPLCSFRLPRRVQACSAHRDEGAGKDFERMASFLTGSCSFTGPCTRGWGQTGRRRKMEALEGSSGPSWAFLGHRGPPGSFSRRPFPGSRAAWVTPGVHGWGRHTTKDPGIVSVYPKTQQGSGTRPPARFAEESLPRLQLGGLAGRLRAVRRCDGRGLPCLKVGKE